ncbi:putative Ig domain-containing protein [Pantoea coffeiphila]|uniref:putative Ig domain-containing protein n=1 Tax=Pantoea coffeiphila TaxID=1465635 RepID=UPI0019601ED4|nr:putative Ig domain-containing protein [Pantoea coffeiphila]MBM7341799.1 6-phosphogluconolactonase (cycloisomerase 2 family) [Pantoea coffeiphila]
MKKSSTRPAWSLTLALEPRMMFDAAAVTTAADVADATAVATTAPVATATPVSDAVFSIDASGTPGADVHLFSNASVAADSSGDEISKLTISVNTSGSNQALVIDGTAITLTTTSAFGETANSHYSYSVAIADNTTTITLFLTNAGTVTPDAVETLINGISYRALDGEVANGTVTVRLGTLSDAQNHSTDLDISSTVTIDNDKNLAPEVDSTGDLTLLDDLTVSDLADGANAVSYSPDGAFAYVASSKGSVVVYSVSDSGVLTKLQTFSDTANFAVTSGMAVGDKAVYLLNVVLSADGNSATSSIITLTRAADGTLTFASKEAIGDKPINMAISEDGKQLYISSNVNGIYIYDINAQGALTFADRLTTNVDRHAGLTSVGDYVFVMNPGGEFETLTVLKRVTKDGVNTLEEVTNTTVTSTRDFTYQYQVAASSDGSVIYTLNTNNGKLIAWSFNGSVLTQIETRTISSAKDVVISSDNTLLYVSTSSGELSVYAIASTGALTLVSSQTTGGSTALASNGTSLAVVGGSSVEVYTSLITYTVGGSPVAVTTGMNVSDSNFDVLNNGAGNYKGASITLTASGSSDSQYSFASDGGLTQQGSQLLLNGSVIGTVAASGNTVKITFTADVTTATANQVLQQVMWATTGTSSALVTLSVVVNDGQLNSNTGTVLLRVNTSPLLNQEVAAGYTLPQATTETDYWLELPALFSDADGENLIWSVTGLPDGLTFNAETHTISGSTTAVGTFSITISAKDSTGASASLTLSLAVAQIDNRAPQTNWDASSQLSSAVVNESFTMKLDTTLFKDADAIYGDTLTWTVEGLPEGLTFDAETLTISGTATSLSDNYLTITVTDKSGDSASRDMTLRVITADEAANTQPTLGPQSSSLIYTSKGGLENYGYYVDAIKLSDDGTSLVVIGGTSTNWGGTIYVSVYSRDTSTGELTLQKTYTQGSVNDGNDANGIEIDGIQGTTQSAFSADGNTLYLSGTNSSGKAVLQAFTLGDDGSLTLISGAEIGATAVKLVVSDDGSSVYAVSASGLYRYSVDAQGKLTAQESFTGLSSVLSMSLDANGTLYVISSTGNMSLYSTDSSGVLSYAGKLTRDGTALTWTDKDGNASSAGTLGSSSGLNGTFTQMSVSDDGYVYVVTGTNGYLTVLHYDAANGSMSLISSKSVSSEVGGFPMSVTVSADGTALYVGTNAASLAVYTIGEDGSLTFRNTLQGDGAMIAVAVSDDGKSIYGGSRYYKTGLRSFDSSTDLVSVAWTERGSNEIASQLVLRDVDYDAANGGAGNYNGATITMEREGWANADDSYSLKEGNGLTLENGNILLNGTAIASFTVSEGTLTVTFTADVTTAVANQVLHQISWQSTSKAPGSTLTMVVSISDPWTTASQSVEVNVTEINDAPEVSSQATDPTYRDTSGSTLVFSNTVVDTIENDQSIVQITLSVSGLVNGESDYLVIDGKNVLLADGVRVLTDSNIVVTVSVTDGVASVTIVSDAGISAEKAQTLINTLSYGNPDAYLGSREIVLTGIKDNGGTALGGSDSTDLDIHSVITLQAQDAGPQLSSPDSDKLAWAGSLSEVSGLGTIIQSVLSDDGTNLYAIDGSGKVALFSRDTATGALTWLGNMDSGLGKIDKIALIDNGSKLVISTSGKAEGAPDDEINYSLNIFSIGTDGTLTQLDTVQMWDISSVLVSDDGLTIYVYNQSGLSAIAIDAETGKMTSLGDVEANAFDPPHLWQPVAQVISGDYLFIVTDPVSSQFPNAIIVYQRQADGTLALLGAVFDQDTDASGSKLSIDSPSAITASEDGSLIYVATSSGLQIFSLNQKSGQIVQTGVMSDISGVTALATSSDSLYVTLSDGTLQAYSIGNSGKLTLTSSWSSSEYAALNGATKIITTRDGGVIVSGSQLASLITVVEEVRYTVGSGAELNFSSDVTLKDKALDLLNDGSGNYGGASVTVTDSSGLGSFAFTADSGLTLNADGQVVDNGTVIGSFSQHDGVLVVTFADGVSSATAGRVISSLVWNNADNSTGRTVTLSLIVSDGELTSGAWQQAVTINHAPQSTDVSYQPAVITLGTAYTATLPQGMFTDADNDTLSWSISGLPDGITFDAATRTLSGTATSAGVYSLTITVTDGDGASATRQLELRVNTTPELGTGETSFSVSSGTAISVALADTLFSDADGDALTWQADNLPAGLSFDAETHTLSGTLPSGRYTLTLTATDAWGASVSRTLVLLANRAPQVTDATFTPDQPIAGINWQQTLPADLFNDADGDDLTWSVSGLPDGLSFDADSRTLSGRAATDGSYLITVSVTDPYGGVASRTFTLTIQPAGAGVSPVVMTPVTLFPQADGDAERFIWQEREPEFIPVSAEAPRDPLVLSDTPVLASGPLDYQAAPWQLDPLMPTLMPTLEKVNFTSRTADNPALARATAWRGEWHDGGNGQQVYALPPGLAGRGGIVSVQLANGRPLPEWIRYDAARSELQINAADAGRVGQVQLRLERAGGAPALLLTLHGSESARAAAETSERFLIPTTGVRAQTQPDVAFNQGVSHSLNALRGDGDDLLQALNALARD